MFPRLPSLQDESILTGLEVVDGSLAMFRHVAAAPPAGTPHPLPMPHRWVAERLASLVGFQLSQRELLTLRNGLFRNVMPPASRGEKRSKLLNMQTFERLAESVLLILESRNAVAEILRVVLASRGRQSDREKVLMAICEIRQVEFNTRPICPDSKHRRVGGRTG
jgi:hypothetical protein